MCETAEKTRDNIISSRPDAGAAGMEDEMGLRKSNLRQSGLWFQRALSCVGLTRAGAQVANEPSLWAASSTHRTAIGLSEWSRYPVALSPMSATRRSNTDWCRVVRIIEYKGNIRFADPSSVHNHNC